MPKVEDDALDLLKQLQIPRPRETFAADIVAQAKEHSQNRIKWLNPLRQIHAFFHIPRFRQFVIYAVVAIAITIGLIGNPPTKPQNDMPVELATLDAETLYVEDDMLPEVIFAASPQITQPDPLSDMDFGEEDWIESL